MTDPFKNWNWEQKIQEARIAMIHKYPFFGYLLLNLAPQPATFITTMATDGKSLFYNVEFLKKLYTRSNGQIHHSCPAGMEFVLAHEICHCALGHIFRRQGRNPDKWNRATDYAANSLLINSGLRMPEGGLYDPQYEGMTAEHIYDRLPDDICTCSGNDGKDNVPSSKNSPPEVPKTHSGPCHGCQVLDAPVDAKDGAISEAEWRTKVAQAAQMAATAGNLPANLSDFVAKTNRPSQDWRALLQRFVSQTAPLDYSYRRINRRYIGDKIMLPSLCSETLDGIVVVIDTSGSVSDRALGQFMTEIQAILDNTRPRNLYVIQCDAAIQHVSAYEPGDIISGQMTGRGGTDFRPPFKFIEENDLEVNCLIYLTDLEGPFPDPPNYSVLWCTVTNHDVPFGEKILLEVY